MRSIALVGLAACSAPSTPPPVLAATAPVEPACATLALHVAEEMSSYMQSLAEAKPAGVRVETEQWSHQPDGSLRFDWRLVAADRGQIERVLATPLPADRMIVYERRGGEWWSYFVERNPTLVTADVATATADGDRLVLTVTEAAKRALEDQTAMNIERKLAILVDGVVIAAPVIAGINTTGRLEITVGDARTVANRISCSLRG